MINQSYKRDLNRCAGGPVYFPTDTLSFYLNTPLSDPDYPNFRLDILHRSTQVLTTNVATLQRHLLNVVSYNLYADITLPGLALGDYELHIYSTSTGTVKAVSSSFQVIDPETPNTAVLSYRNDTNLYGFDYEGLPDYYNKVRYPLIEKVFSIDKDIRQYRNQTNLQLRNLYSYRDTVYEIESYRVSHASHEAISGIYDHNTIFLNQTAITPKSGYTVDDELRSVLSSGRINVVRNLFPPSNFIPPVSGVDGIFSVQFSTEFA